MGIEVCELRRKFQLLKSYGVIKSLNDIADKVVRAENTLWGWADGNATTEANQVPSRNFEAFRIAFIEVLKGHVAPERAEALLFAPAFHLKNELRRARGPQTPRPMELIEAEADTTAIRLIRLADEQNNERGLIETQADRRHKGPVHQVKQGEWFRLVVERDLSAYNILALQHGAGLWGSVPWSIIHSNGHLHLPDKEEKSPPTYMREQAAIGQNEFYILATRSPTPRWAIEPSENRQPIDHSLVSALFAFYEQERLPRRLLFVAFVTVTTHNGHSV